MRPTVRCRVRRSLLLLAAIGLASSRTSAVTFDWVIVGDPGNAADTEVMVTDGTTGYGFVPYVYRVSKFEVTNTQYAEFLNAVAVSDPNFVYNPNTEVNSDGGITRSGTDGSFAYTVKAGFEDKPAVYVGWFATLRFANWMHNGQPSGGQDTSTTEDGSYSFSDSVTVGTRNPWATFVLTSEDEWYKAAYYDPLLETYFDYPTGSDTFTADNCVLPPGGTNSANCFGKGGGVTITDVGAYPFSDSPWGTFDQGGNVWEWNESRVGESSNRGMRGGSQGTHFSTLSASFRGEMGECGSGCPLGGAINTGFRVALVPEPSFDALRLCTIAVLAALAVQKRKPSQRPR